MVHPVCNSSCTVTYYISTVGLNGRVRFFNTHYGLTGLLLVTVGNNCSAADNVHVKPRVGPVRSTILSCSGMVREFSICVR